MAPGKRKKKPATNPARGFSTSSVASKQQAAETLQSQDPKVDSGDLDLCLTGKQEEKNVKLASPQQAPLKQLHDLSPEELERQLEESELEFFVEKFLGKVNKEVSRHLARLETDRRLLRQCSDNVIPSDWLSLDICTEIESLFLQQENIRKNTYPRHTCPNRDVSRDDQLAITWQLSQILLQLGFASEDVTEAILHVLEARTYIDDRGETLYALNRDLSIELEEALNWLATAKSQLDPFDYDRERRNIASVNKNIETIEAQDKDIDTCRPDISKAGSSTHVIDESKSSSGKTDEEEGCGDSGDDSDLEPEDMLEKYVHYQTQIYNIDPSLSSVPAGWSSKKQKQSQKLKSYEKDAAQLSNPKTRRWREKIKKLQSDMLFDQESADEKWSITKLQLDIDRRVSITQNRSKNRQTHMRASELEVETDPPADPEDPVEISTLFCPEDSTELPSECTSHSQCAPIKEIELHDFGTWSGIQPRKLLEEVCKSRDGQVKIFHRALSELRADFRQSVVIEWSKPQELSLFNPFEKIKCEWQPPRTVRLFMTSTSCPDKLQAESFICTVALFTLFSQSNREEKVSLRLPSVWRNLWNEMLQVRKSLEYEESKEQVKRLKNLMEHTSSRKSDSSIISSAPARKELDEKPDLKPTVSHTSTNGPKGFDQIVSANRQKWTSTASSMQYQRMLASRRTLPIWAYRAMILHAVHENQIVIICGQTGCGKSTQVPSYIMEDELANDRVCKIFCAEPRRISAISLARRVSEELGEKYSDLGTSRSLVGYAVRLESKMVDSNNLIYATTGAVLRLVEKLHDLDGISHLILDEVHERSIDSDFLLIILRKIMHRRPDLRVILMSATVDAQKFSQYLGNAPVLDIPGKTYPVEVLHVEDIVEDFRHLSSSNPDFDEELPATTVSNSTTISNKHHDNQQPLQSAGSDKARILSKEAEWDEYSIPFDLIANIIENIPTSAYAQYGQAILVFLPGIAEIRRMQNILLGREATSALYDIFALHSSLAADDQERVFRPPRHGMRKIVLATNIAETGITIPDITCVIDTGKHKEMRYDEKRQVSRLIESFISKANALQRRGRAGRVQNGICFHLFTKARFEKMAVAQTPEMLRLSLQDLVLRVKICRLGRIEETLSEALDAPTAKNVRRAIESLQDIKALTSSQELTPLGRQLAELPLDVFLGKCLILGTIFGCLDTMLTIAATLSSKTPFVTDIAHPEAVDNARAAFERGGSDLLTVYSMYKAWRRICISSNTSEMQFCRKNSLSSQALSNIEELKGQLVKNLVSAGFVRMDEHDLSSLEQWRFSHKRQRSFVPLSARYNSNNDNDLLINSIIAASFYPKLVRREGKGWRNVATNQSISLHQSSVVNGLKKCPIWLSYHHVMSSGNRVYKAHEVSAVHTIAILMLCGEAEFKLYPGIIMIDGNRIKFTAKSYQTIVSLRRLRCGVQSAMDGKISRPSGQAEDLKSKWLSLMSRIMQDFSTGTDAR